MNENNQTQASVKDIQQQIAKKFGFEKLEDKTQQELINKMSESVVKRVIVDAYEQLNDTDRDALADLMDENNPPAPDAVDSFLNEKLEDYGAVIKNAIDDLEKHMGQALEGVAK
ncbi:MAG: hypothetical protein KAT32_04130 [Candidatus Moranbacteria bacterium]|nr:hypothetical protein [Candidatus Moranbacteria bacterium]